MNDKRNALWVLVGMIVMAALFMFIGFMAGKAKYDKPIVETVTRDTVTIVDTIPHYYPKAVEVEKVRTEFKYLTRIEHIADTSKMIVHDSVLVEVPIESKHYSSPEYDAYISGYMPSLDSIKVYQKETIITETITRMKPPNKWELDLVGGINYDVHKKKYTPFAGGELLYKPSRFQLGIRGGVVKDDKVEPTIGGVVKIKIF